MSIFFWKKKKPEPEAESEVSTPVTEAEPEEAAPGEAAPSEESDAVEEPEQAAPSEESEEAAEAEASEPEEEPDRGDTREFQPVSAISPEESGANEPAVLSGEEDAEAEAIEPEENAEAEASEPEEEDPRERKPRRKSRALLWIFLLLLVIGGCYYYGYTYSQTHFLKNTYINGMDVSNMTAPEVEKILSTKAEGYELKITFRDGEVEVIDAAAIGFKVKPDGSVDRILQSQDHKEWFRCFFRRTDGKVEQKTTYDPNRLREAVAALPELQTDYMVTPVDAYIELHDTTFSIIPEVEGNLVDVELVQKAAQEAVAAEETSVVVTDIEGVYKEPSVRATDADIVEKCDSYNHMLAGSITWNLPSGDTITVDADTTVKWLSVDENGNYYRDEDLWKENIEFWVDEVARNVNTVGQSWDFHSTNSGDITVSGGDYGYSVNKVEEREEVWNLLWDGESEEREPYFYTIQYNHSNGIGDTYIEANLSAQHVWIYVDGVMVCDTDCVSGNTSLGRGTPTGVFQILYKDTDVDLKGQQLANGQYSYISHVDYWMPFYGGCGFHDASWRSRFGGTIYKTDGSHGCINLPTSIVPKFYSYVEAGMPVVVYY